MATIQNGDLQRKSSVYNQTGENYFEQLSAYNRMNCHLRRILMANSVVDSRNKKYTRDKRLSAGGTSTCAKSLDHILSRRDIIDGIAYDTLHNPLNLLRTRLGCDTECRGQKSRKRMMKEAHRSRNDNLSCRDGSPEFAGPSDSNVGTFGNRKTSQSRSPTKSFKRPHGSARSSIVAGRGCAREPEVLCIRSKYNDEDRRKNRNDRIVETINETYSYDSSFESSSDNSSVDYSTNKNCPVATSSRINYDANQDRNAVDVEPSIRDEPFETAKRNEDAKYAKFLYDITQEIVRNGLYTDQELREVFAKHVEANSRTLDRDKMLMEIEQLKASLDMKDFSNRGDKGKNVDTLSRPEIHVSRTKALFKSDEHKSAEIPSDRGETRADDASRPEASRSAAKNAILLLDTSPETVITEREVLVTLMEMKLDPRKVRTICGSLRANKIDEATQLRTDEASPGERILTHQVAVDDARKKIEQCHCQCHARNATFVDVATERSFSKLPIRIGESQTTDEKSEIGIQTSGIVSETRGITTLTSLDRLNATWTDEPKVTTEPKRGQNIISKEEATMTDTAMERGASLDAPRQGERKPEITDGELTSLTKVYSQNVEEASSMVAKTEENAEKSGVSSKTRSETEKSWPIVTETEDAEGIDLTDESEREIRIETQLNSLGRRRDDGESKNDLADDRVVVESSRESSKHDEQRIKSDEARRILGSSIPSSPDHDQRKPQRPKEGVRYSGRSTGSGNSSLVEIKSRRFQAECFQCCTPAMCELNSCKKRKKNERIRGSRTKQLGSSDHENGARQEISRISARSEEPRQTIDERISVNNGSRVSLADKEISDEASIRVHETPLESNVIENEAYLEAERDTVFSIGEHGSTEMVTLLEQRLENPSVPRRDTIHRRMSLIRSVRSAMESLKKRLSTNTLPSTRSSDISVGTTGSANTRTSRASGEMRDERRDEISITRDTSKNTSCASLETVDTSRETMENEKVSAVSSIDVSIYSAPEIEHSNDEALVVFPKTNRCPPDCPGSQYIWKRRSYLRYCRSNPRENSHSTSPPTRDHESAEDEDRN